MSTNKNLPKWPLIISTSLSAVFLLVPALNPLAYPFLLLSTLVHEMGHGVAAMLVGGQFVSFKMWFNGSGVANIYGDFGALARAFVAAAGLVGPAIIAAISFCFIRSERSSRVYVGLMGFIFAISAILVVRNIFGVVFVGILCLVCYLFSFGYLKNHAQTMLAFFAMQLAISVFSRSDYLFMDVAQTSAGFMPSDTAQIAQALFLPYWFWGIVCGLFSLVVLGFGIRRIFK